MEVYLKCFLFSFNKQFQKSLIHRSSFLVLYCLSTLIRFVDSEDWISINHLYGEITAKKGIFSIEINANSECLSFYEHSKQGKKTYHILGVNYAFEF